MNISNTSGGDPEKAAIEAAVAQALGHARRDWDWVVENRTPTLWSVVLERATDGYRAAFAVPGPRQRAGTVERCVRTVLDTAPRISGSSPS